MQARAAQVGVACSCKSVASPSYAGPPSLLPPLPLLGKSIHQVDEEQVRTFKLICNTSNASITL